MIKNYLRTAMRHILRHKLFSFIHIIGLALGLACFFLSYYHIRYEYSYDQHFSKSQDIYRLVTGDVAGGDGWVKVSAPLPVKLKADIPEIQEYLRMTNLNKASKTVIYYDQKSFYEQHFFLADPTVTDFFDLQFTAGHESSLGDLKSLVLSQSKALQIFGYRNPIGEVLRINDKFEFTVGGVFEDLHHNSHLRMDFIVPFQNLETMLPGTSLAGNWGQYNYFGYVQLHPDAQEGIVESKIGQMAIKLNEENTFSLEAINLQALTDIHFQYNRGNLQPTYQSRNAWIYGIAALAILLLSIINYINLSTASSSKRLKEVGLRKTIGANQQQLILQFIGESFVLTMIAALVSLALVRFVLLAWVNTVFDTQLVMQVFDPALWGILLTAILVVSLLSGALIAYYIIKVQPVKALKGGTKVASGKQPLRNLLVGFQFMITIMLLSSALFIQSQLQHLQQQDLGLVKDGVINIPLYEQQWKKDIKLIKKELEQLSSVQASSATGFQAGIANWHQTVWWEGQQDDASMNIIDADADLIETLGLNIKEGNADKLLSDQIQGMVYVVNESAAQLIAGDKTLGHAFSPFGPERKKPIAAIVEDFNYKSLHHAIEPVVLVLGSNFEPDQLLIKIQDINISSALSDIRNKFNEISPGVAFEYAFMDENFAGLYLDEQRSEKTVSFYTTIAIFLSFLGLFGMVSFELNERRKEMAVRKVLGITDFGMGLLISKKFIYILGVACLLALPTTWYFLDQWLQNFTYRINIRWELFLLAIASIFLLIAGIMVIKWLQFKRSNLANVIKYE